jgi:hypothetical protein
MNNCKRCYKILSDKNHSEILYCEECIERGINSLEKTESIKGTFWDWVFGLIVIAVFLGLLMVPLNLNKYVSEQYNVHPI